MLKKETYESAHIENIRTTHNTDPTLIERALFAFRLLEALSSVKLPFIFKGGTSLLLLLDEPIRLSTDIDILVRIDIDVMPYLEQVATIFPFVEQREHERIGQSKNIKRQT